MLQRLQARADDARGDPRGASRRSAGPRSSPRSSRRPSSPARCRASASSRKCWSISGSTTSTCSRRRARCAGWCPPTSARRSVRTCSAASATRARDGAAPGDALLPRQLAEHARRTSSRCRARPARAGREPGLNENYARELMELHTLGVDGGYTQQDVVEVARCFTGWTIDRPAREGGGFLFRPAAHDAGEKRVLGQAIPAGGGEDGRRARDRPPRAPPVDRALHRDQAGAALRQRRAAARRWWSAWPRTFLEHRTATSAAVHRAHLQRRPSSVAAEAYRAKIKTPLEVVAAPRVRRGSTAAERRRAARRRRGRCARAGGPAGRAALRGAAAHRLSRRGRGVGERGRAARPHELRARAGPQPRAAARASTWRAPRGADRARAGAGARPAARGGAPRRRRRRRPARVLAAQLESPEITRATADDRGPKDTDVESSPRSSSARPSSRGDERMDGCTRRSFMKRRRARPAGVGARPRRRPALPRARGLRAAAPPPAPKVLIAIFQRGAVDGLSMVVRTATPTYYAARGGIAIARPAAAARPTPRSTSTASSACTRRSRRSSRSGTSGGWRRPRRAARPTPRARTSTPRTTWSRARPA